MKTVLLTLLLIAFAAGDAWALRGEEEDQGQQPRRAAEILMQINYIPNQDVGWWSSNSACPVISAPNVSTYHWAVFMGSGAFRWM